MKTGSARWRKVIVDGGAILGVDLRAEHVEKFAVHAAELDVWNRRINLTAITDPKGVAVKHFVDALAAVPLIPNDAVLLDIGSGAGFPGIPLKVAIPSLTVLLIDGSRKKINFQRHVIRTLGLKGIRARHIRAEEMRHDPMFRKKFDVIVSRALTDLESMVSLAEPLLKAEGAIIAFRGRIGQEEGFRSPTEILSSKAFEGLRPPEVKCYTLPFISSERAIVILKRRPINPDV